ncbi:hypothetical protein [Janthinobacterium sp. HH104]|uniref:hypothetical protein n=1 Tax=Janthinobacterium sp. HH104 TaxID=1537276 RepID=UPI0011131D7E|nr:hypothetical protein [Janthinobacterium sp. HH104]
MNKNLLPGYSDPRTEFVPIRYLQLAADLILAKQNVAYWNAVPVPEAPNNRLPYEELRQAAVFVPLVLVAIAYMFFGFIGACVVFVVALPLMNMIHNALEEAIARKGREWFFRDAGRYSFTKFMCKEFDLRPEDVTLPLVYKMCGDLKMWLIIAKRLTREDAIKAEAALKAAKCFPKSQEFAAGAAAVATAFSTVAIIDDPANAMTNDLAIPELQFNPASGLPMLDDVFDVHGNTFGSNNVDDLWQNTNDFNSSGSGVFDNIGCGWDGEI